MFGLKLFKKNLLNLLPEVRGKYTPNVRLAKYTWFGVGGPAEVLYTPADAEDLSHFLKNKPYNLPVCVIGGGSNLLVRDGGVPGVVIRLSRRNFNLFTQMTDMYSHRSLRADRRIVPHAAVNILRRKYRYLRRRR